MSRTTDELRADHRHALAHRDSRECVKAHYRLVMGLKRDTLDIVGLTVPDTLNPSDPSRDMTIVSRTDDWNGVPHFIIRWADGTETVGSWILPSGDDRYGSAVYMAVDYLTWLDRFAESAADDAAADAAARESAARDAIDAEEATPTPTPMVAADLRNAVEHLASAASMLADARTASERFASADVRRAREALTGLAASLGVTL